MFFAIDIDGTITEPRWYDLDVQRCMERYIKEGIVYNSVTSSVE